MAVDEKFLRTIESVFLALEVLQERQTNSLETLVSILQDRQSKKEKTNSKRTASTKFMPPTLDEVEAYVKEIKSKINANHFIDYYAARGWKLTNGSFVVSWKACVRTWTRNNFISDPAKESLNTGAVL